MSTFCKLYCNAWAFSYFFGFYCVTKRLFDSPFRKKVCRFSACWKTAYHVALSFSAKYAINKQRLSRISISSIETVYVFLWGNNVLCMGGLGAVALQCFFCCLCGITGLDRRLLLLKGSEGQEIISQIITPKCKHTHKHNIQQAVKLGGIFSYEIHSFFSLCHCIVNCLRVF